MLIQLRKYGLLEERDITEYFERTKIVIKMDSCQSKQRYDRPPPPPEVQVKLDLCKKETAGLSVREIKCPKCNFVIDRVFSDVSGHFISKVPNVNRNIS